VPGRFEREVYLTSRAKKVLAEGLREGLVVLQIVVHNGTTIGIVLARDEVSEFKELWGVSDEQIVEHEDMELEGRGKR
jgi:hypothetical protein